MCKFHPIVFWIEGEQCSKVILKLIEGHSDLEEEAIFMPKVLPIARIHHLNSVSSPQTQICFKVSIQAYCETQSTFSQWI